MLYRALTPSDYAQLPSDIQHPPHGMVAVNDSGEIVGLCGFIPILHLDPLWIREDHRKSPFLLRRLWAKTQAMLKGENVPFTLGFALEGDKTVEHIAAWAGGVEIKGKLFAFRNKE